MRQYLASERGSPSTVVPGTFPGPWRKRRLDSVQFLGWQELWELGTLEGGGGV